MNGFVPLGPDPAGVVSFVHFGDLHMTRAGQQNDQDLQALVAQVNAVFAGSVSFVYLPGDVADDGSASAYAVVRNSLDRLQLPWVAILGDHDVHEKSFANFLAAMSDRTHFAFSVGTIRFLCLNAFDVPEPSSFTVGDEQLNWLEGELSSAQAGGAMCVVLLHCYPSDLKVGGNKLSALLRQYRVRLVEMGHTHYNELSNDGVSLYAATRSTGQIEEGSVGYSVTSIDADVLSWRFFELGQLPAVMITSPADLRLMPDNPAGAAPYDGGLRVRAKIWGGAGLRRVHLYANEQRVEMSRIEESHVWQGLLLPVEGEVVLRVEAEDGSGAIAWDEIRTWVGEGRASLRREPRDQDNALAAWPEHGLLGTQLGPNKNGRKW